MVHPQGIMNMPTSCHGSWACSWDTAVLNSNDLTVGCVSRWDLMFVVDFSWSSSGGRVLRHVGCNVRGSFLTFWNNQLIHTCLFCWWSADSGYRTEWGFSRVVTCKARGWFWFHPEQFCLSGLNISGVDQQQVTHWDLWIKQQNMYPSGTFMLRSVCDTAAAWEMIEVILDDTRSSISTLWWRIFMFCMDST